MPQPQLLVILEKQRILLGGSAPASLLLPAEINVSVLLLCQPPLEKLPWSRVRINMLHFKSIINVYTGRKTDPEARGRVASFVAGCPLQLAETVRVFLKSVGLREMAHKVFTLSFPLPYLGFVEGRILVGKPDATNGFPTNPIRTRLLLSVS